MQKRTQRTQTQVRRRKYSRALTFPSNPCIHDTMNKISALGIAIALLCIAAAK